jgi:Cyclin, C-terminal domain./Cyclin, N-terminal domain.
MLIASKFEEIYAVEVNDFVYISDNAFTKEEILSVFLFFLQPYCLTFPLSNRWNEPSYMSLTLFCLLLPLCTSCAVGASRRTVTPPPTLWQSTSPSSLSSTTNSSLSCHLSWQQELCTSREEWLTSLHTGYTSFFLYLFWEIEKLNIKIQNQTIEFYTGIREAEVIPAARCLNELLLRQPKSSLKATRRKYEGPRLLEVAKIPPLHPFWAQSFIQSSHH